MKTTLHIVAKDLRRLAVPALAWLGFIAASMVWFASTRPELHGHLGVEVDTWTSMMAIWTRLLLAVQLMLGFVLAGALVQEDPVPGTEAFWLTRPIARWRMLAAKLISAGLIFGVAPLGLQLAVWLVRGFSIENFGPAWRQTMLLHSYVALFAVGVAALTRTLAQFLFAALGVLLGYVVCCQLWPVTGGRGVEPEVWQARTLIVEGGSWLVLAFLAVHQFLTRRPSRGWLLLGGALLAGMIVRGAWPVGWPTPRELSRHVPKAAQPGMIEIEPEMWRWRRNDHAQPQIRIKGTWTPERFFLPIAARDAAGELITFERLNLHEASLRVLGLSTKTDPIHYGLSVDGRAARGPVADDFSLKGAVEFREARLRVVGEIPLRENAELVAGGSRMRIAGVAREEGRIGQVVIEERSAAAMSTLLQRGQRESVGHARTMAQYLVLDRTSGAVSVLARGGEKSVGFRGERVTFIHSSLPARDWEKAVVVKLQLELGDASAQPFDLRGVRYEREEGGR